MNIRQILKKLPEATYSPATQTTDASIELGDYEVQISGDTFLVNLWDEEDESLETVLTTKDPQELIDYLAY